MNFGSAAAAELAPALDRDVEAEEQHLDLDGERRLAPTTDCRRSPSGSRAEIEGERHGDQPEHRQLAVQAHVAGELDRSLAGPSSQWK